MKREEIENILKQNDSSVLSFKDRGPWGDNKYRGNCSGYVQAYLIWKYQVQRMAELFAGSGTGYDVCQDMKIGYFGADLNPNPVRPNICCLDAFVDEVPEAFSFADFVFMHPPYGTELRIIWGTVQARSWTNALAGVHKDIKQRCHEVFCFHGGRIQNGNPDGRCQKEWTFIFHADRYCETR